MIAETNSSEQRGRDIQPVLVPDVGAGSESVRVSAWFSDVGEEVTAGEAVAEILIAGVTCDIPAVASGRLVRIEKSLNSVVFPQDVLGWIEPEHEIAD